MRLTKEQKEDMIKRIMAKELSYSEAATEYGVSYDLVRKYMSCYKQECLLNSSWALFISEDVKAHSKTSMS